MQFKDYYRVIGVAPDANAEQIKTAYRKLARKLHPDVSKEKDAAKRFADLGEAYEALKDPEKRAAYDQLRADGWRDGQEMHAPPRPAGGRGQAGPEFGGGDDFSDFFQSLFGQRGRGGRRGGMRERGEDLHVDFAISLEEAFRGGDRQFTLRAPGRDAHGGMAETLRTITVKIPAGVTTGSQVRLRGQGHPGATPGDLYLDITLEPHRFYRVDGRDLHLDLPIAPWEAVLGAQVPVPTLGGTVTATIPAGAKPGQQLRLKGRGLPGEPPGDQYLTLIVGVPASASARATELWQELAREAAFNPRAGLGV